MTPPAQPRQTTRVMAAVQASHGRPLTGPRYAVGAVLLAFSLTVFALCTIWRIEMTVFQQRFIGGVAVAGFAVLPVAEAAVRFIGGLLTAYKGYKNPQGGQ